MNDPDIYTAEKILNKREYRGVTQYLIKWNGFSLKESTWEPVENIIDQSLLTTFLEQKKKSRRKKKGKRSKPTPTPSKASNGTTNGTSSAAATNGHTEDNEQDDMETEPEFDSNTPELHPISTPSRVATPKAQASPVDLNSPKTGSRSPFPPSPKFQITEVCSNSPRPLSNQSAQAGSPSKSTSLQSPKPPTPSPAPQTPRAESPKPTQQLQQTLVPSPKIQSPSVQQPVLRQSPAPINNVPQSLSSQTPRTPSSYNSINVYKPQVAINQQPPLQVMPPKNKKFAVMNTVITDVTVNDHTITISESKTGQGFFKEVSRNRVDAETQFSI